MKYPLHLALVSGLLAAAAPVVAQTVLYSARPSIALSVSDKMATKQAPVEFTVTLPDAKTTSATAQPRLGGDSAGTVNYPGDFGNAGTRVGNYSWTARIGGRVVLTGRFAYQAAQKGQTLFVPD